MSDRLTDEELLAKMKAHIKERKAVYDALDDDTNNRVIANSGIESLHTADQGEYEGQVVQASVLERWSEVIAEKQYTTLPGRLAEALIALDECNFDHDCGGEGDYPRCKECRAVRLLRTMILELGAHGIGR